ncbi:MAG: N-acetyltransferase, partial [Rhodobacteraceae bacterium]|nr:N-acetyltransferase [Paracoccaceae bacterium]
MKLDAITTQPVVETARFVLRPLRRSDAGLIEFYTKDERVARQTTTIPHPLPPGATETFINRCLSVERDEDVWAIDASAAGWSEVVGLVSLERLSRNQSELGYW